MSQCSLKIRFSVSLQRFRGQESSTNVSSKMSSLTLREETWYSRI